MQITIRDAVFYQAYLDTATLRQEAYEKERLSNVATYEIEAYAPIKSKREELLERSKRLLKESKSLYAREKEIIESAIAGW